MQQTLLPDWFSLSFLSKDPTNLIVDEEETVDDRELKTDALEYILMEDLLYVFSVCFVLFC